MNKKLIEKYKNRLDVLRGDLKEINEMYEDFDPMDWSGGNFDDAYNLGREHEETFKEVEMIKVFIKELEKSLAD